MSSERAAWLVDTNVLVYAYDLRSGPKRMRAQETLERLFGGGRGRISAQVLGEFYVTVTRKLNPPLAQREAEKSVTNWARSWTVLGIEAATVLEAMRLAGRYRLSYCDALILSTAKIHEIPNVLSEDFQDGVLLEGVRFLDPFRPGFDPASLTAA